MHAAGDATACPVKHVDVACAQADAVADVLAARAGAEIAPTPWRPVMREHHLAAWRASPRWPGSWSATCGWTRSSIACSTPHAS
jgi:hypothetical protein